MRTETYKAIENKQKKHPVRNWWNKNKYKISRVILFPIWGCIVIKDKFLKYKYKQTTWDEERTNEILNYYVPNFSDWDEEEKTFFFFDNGCGWNSNYTRKKYIKRKDFYYWKKFASYEIRNYLIEKFELEDFEKQVVDSDCGSWTEIVFRQKKEK